jgi:hypothetical protein
VDRGIYKIVSTADVVVTAKPDSMRVERFNPKDTGPEQARRAVAETFPDITISQLQAFFTVADGRVLLNP